MTWKPVYWWGVGAAALIVAVVGYPMFTANNRFQDAMARGDNRAACLAANEAAEEWAGLGFSGTSENWRSNALLPCLSASAGR